jgi:hypothetical protein
MPRGNGREVRDAPYRRVPPVRKKEKNRKGKGYYGWAGWASFAQLAQLGAYLFKKNVYSFYFLFSTKPFKQGSKVAEIKINFFVKFK